jgi:esterase/lipase
MDVRYLQRAGRPEIAYVHSPAAQGGEKHPMVMFLGGYRSDMSGTKATYLEEQCRARGQGYLRFDYSGHGMSGGIFAQGTIGAWKQDALDILDHITREPVVLVGSSMGGWMALLVAQARAGMIHALVGIAAAPDFTESIYASLNAAQKAEFMQAGKLAVANDYSAEPYAYTKQFYEEAKEHLLLDKSHTIDFPLRLIQGMRDKDVKWETAVKIQKTFRSDESDVIFIEDGDHRLSRPEDLEIIDKEVRSVSGYF